ncbi:hypothetical protein GALL_507720 [mine drainage metagenome]|uniref:Uncharacterized protein n=1 Tax=mine drainage metagenome TaxID=410659 RepID=A0A1J5PIR9_9ZZZZ
MRNLDSDRFVAIPFDNRTACTVRGDSHTNTGENFVVGPTGLLRGQRPLVFVGEKVSSALDQLADLVAIHPSHLLRRVGGEWNSEGSTGVGVPEHRVGIVGSDQNQIKAAKLLGNCADFNVASFAHGT